MALWRLAGSALSAASLSARAMRQGRRCRRRFACAPRLLAVLAIALVGTLPLARAQTAARSAEPAIAAASVRWLCTGHCTGAPRGFSVDPMREESIGSLVLAMILQAYGLKFDSQIEGAPEWMFWDRYHVEIVSASSVSRKQMDQVLLRKVLAQCFWLRTREVTKTVPGYALVVAPGGIKFPAVQKPQPVHFENGFAHLSTLPQIATVLSQWYYDGKLYGVNRPVQDATAAWFL